MIISTKTNKEYHSNGNLAYIDTKCIVAPLWQHLYDNLRISDNGDIWIRTGLCAKYYDNNQLAWDLNYNNNGSLIKEKRIQYRKDGSIIVY